MSPESTSNSNLFVALFDFKSNFFNWIVLIGLLGWLIAKYCPPLFAQRRQSIQSQMEDASVARKTAELLVSDHKNRIANVEKEIEDITNQARDTAQQLKEQLHQQTQVQVEELKKKLESKVQHERQLALNQMRNLAAEVALTVTKQVLAKELSGDMNARLLNEFVEQIDQVNNHQENSPEKQFEKIC